MTKMREYRESKETTKPSFFVYYSTKRNIWYERTCHSQVDAERSVRALKIQGKDAFWLNTPFKDAFV